MKKLFAVLLALAVALPFAAFAAAGDNPRVRMTTSLGVIEIELDAKHAPDTVKNFMNYVETGF